MQTVNSTQAVTAYRPLGAGEQIFWLHDQAHPVHFVLTAQIRGSFSVEQLTQALTLVQQRHPLLRVRIALDQAEQPWFVEDSACIPLRVMHRQFEQHWQQEVEQEIATSFIWSQAPLIRVVLVHASNDAELSELIVTCHHSIADGISGTYLMRDILQAITTPATFGESLPIPPALEDLVLGKAPKTIALPKPIPKLLSDSFPVVQRAKQNNHSFVSSDSLSLETTLSFISRCRQEQTSVHAAICAAFLLAVRQQNYSEQPQNIICGSPISLRPYVTSVNQEDVSFCITGGRTSHRLSPNNNLWDVARSVKHQLNQSIVPDKLFEQIFQNQEWLTTHPSPDAVFHAFEDQLGYDIAVSNLKRLTIPQKFGELELQAVYGPVVTLGIKNDCLVGVATLGERLFFTLVCSELVMSRSQSKTLLEEATHLLKQAIE